MGKPYSKVGLDNSESNSKSDDQIDLDLTASSYHKAIWDLVNNDATDGDETEKLKSIAKQNITVFALWTLGPVSDSVLGRQENQRTQQTNQLTYESEKVIERLDFTTINLDKLTASQIELYKLIWHD